MTTIQIISDSGFIPTYATPGSSGADLYTHIEDTIILEPQESVLVPTGIRIQIPKGVEAQIRPRSGLALKHKITVLNTPGTIDSDYTGEIGVILINHGKESFEIKNSMKIAQIVFSNVLTVLFEQTNELQDTVRGDGGFGHTGV